MTARKIAIITDSTNNLPAEFISQYQIKVVPLTLVIDGQSYLDGVDIKAEDFYKRLTSEKIHPTTSQPAPGDFLKVYLAAKEEGAEQIIVITISSAMSGTMESARMAAKNIDIPVTIIDSKSNTMGLGWQVLACARARDNGVDVNGIVAMVDNIREHLHLHVMLDTLEYLFKGGRIAGAAKLVNNVLKIKPQIRVNHETGSVEPVDISRTRAKAIESLYSTFTKKLDLTKPLRIAILHNDVLEEAKLLAERIKAELKPIELIIEVTSPVLGVHTGPQALALAGYSES
ncbi:MAG: fatty acid-binding protein DegV [Anaerolinea sp.]|nr:fatty acid-binding protein DegV [Anaerolinea sp.]